MQAIRAAQKSDPDLLMDEEPQSTTTEVESTVTTISSRHPMESQVIAKSSGADDVEANAFAEWLGSLRVNLTPFIGPSTGAAHASSSTDIRINTPSFPMSPPTVTKVNHSGDTALEAAALETPTSRVRPILFAVAALIVLAAGLFFALRR